MRLHPNFCFYIIQVQICCKVMYYCFIEFVIYGARLLVGLVLMTDFGEFVNNFSERKAARLFNQTSGILVTELVFMSITSLATWISTMGA
ncbi:hypothetical protein RJT34_32618 [Clitoria ternatea]|uniref:Uncharacterized protein n=1 Tax=Clitoria ternatea TaxID=43366 RepID=A0AAN9EWT5_CLITE